MWPRKQQVLPLLSADLIANDEKKAKKSVSFASHNTTFEIDYIPDEFFEDVWYSEIEISAINSENMDHAVELSLGIINEGDQFTSRGLEHLGRENNKQRQQTIAKAVMAVLDEQQRQMSLKINDPRLIAGAYRCNGAKRCQKVALSVGLEDVSVSSSMGAKKCRSSRRSFLKSTSKKLKHIGLAFAGNK